MSAIASTLTVLAAAPTPGYKPLPPEVTAELQRWFRYLLWLIEVGLIARILVISGKAGWEHFRPPPGPPDAPGDIVRALLAWSMAATAVPLAASLLVDPHR
ncbi:MULTISPECIES: hypothetical protein [Nocardia]|uniref:Uncharacterized protein n=1 Tax=Nocardia africana TaxID=134964 RepID=A0A378WJ08_9NOCA|nr:hypothetical protein [Nocardia africana]MCC3317983.1 hypothetical protein [Nocardia africana]OBF82353.1 hypothetical protein A9X06_19390 [Mycobacterium sp. 852002-51759_SCH5129042]SUA40707.1 Uncharacterised protein [Nocardia africana]